MTTTATEVTKVRPSLTTQQMRSLKAMETVEPNWRQAALASPVNATGVRAIAAGFATLLDGEDAISDFINTKTGKPNVSATVADVKYGVGYHSRERALYIIDNSPATVQSVFSGTDERGLQSIYDELKVKKNLGKHQEPSTVDRPRGTATLFELKYELYEMLTNSDLEKVLKYALARLHPDNKETGNEAKFKRMVKIWSDIKNVEGV